jgi:hypothetical protein
MEVGTMVQSAQVEAKEWLAPILRQTGKFSGLKITINWISLNDYHTYRLGGKFVDWDDFFAHGKISTVKVNYLGDPNMIYEAAKTLNESRYLKEGKFKVEFERIMFDNGLFNWIEI